MEQLRSSPPGFAKRSALRCRAAYLAFCLLTGIVICFQPALGEAIIEEPAEGPAERALSSAEVVAAPDATTLVKPGRRPRIGLALGGGGTRGAAHVSVIRALEKEGIPIDLIVGTSMGAVVGGLYSAGVSTETLERKFLDRSLMKSFMTVPLWIRLAATPVLAIPRVLGYAPYDGLYQGKEFKTYLEQSVPPGTRNIEDLKIPFAAIALNIANSNIAKIRSGNLGTALQASSAVPGLRKPVQIDDQLYVDGGVEANLPVQQAREMGADFVIAVCVDERLKPVPLDTFRKVGSVTHRVVSLQLKNVDLPQIQKADVVVHPDVDGINLISTSRKDAEKALAAGTSAIQEAMPVIKSKLAARGVRFGIADKEHHI